MQDQSLFQQPEQSPKTNAHGETKALDQASLAENLGNGAIAK